jgi:hypothetical protein
MTVEAIYPPAPEGARIRGVVWCGLKDDEGERYGIPKIFADSNGKATLVWEGPLRWVKDKRLDEEFRAACKHYGYAIRGDLKLDEAGGKCR